VNARRSSLFLTAFVLLTILGVCWPHCGLAAQRVRPSGRAFSGRSSGSMRGARTSGFSSSRSGFRNRPTRSAGSRMYGGGSMMRQPSVRGGGTVRSAPRVRTAGRTRVRAGSPQRPAVRGGGRTRSAPPIHSTGRTRVRTRSPRRPAVRGGTLGRRTPRRTVTSRGRVRPTVRDRSRPVGRTTHRVVRPYDGRWPYYDHYPWRPYYRTYYPYYWHYRPSYWCSWYRPCWWYPYYSGWYLYYGDWSYGGWGVGTSFYHGYSPSYYYVHESPQPAIEVAEPVVYYETPTDAASPDLAEARSLFDSGRYSEAAEIYRRLSIASESDAFVRLAHAHCLLACGRYEYAAYVVRTTVALYPDWEQMFTQLRDYYSDWGVFVNQVVELERYIAEKPDNTAARFLLGYAYLFWDRYGDAAGVFRSLLARQPEDNAVHYFLGMTVSRQTPPEADS